MLLIFVLPLAVIGCGQLGLFSGTAPTDLGLHNGMLKAPESGAINVVSSFTKQQNHNAYSDIEPIHFSGDAATAFDKLKHIIGTMDNATLVRSEPTYLYAHYRTPLLKFVDDVEFVLDAPTSTIHMRSASRLGKGDFGVNRKRLETIRSRFNS